MSTLNDIISDAEASRIILSLARSRGEKGFTEEEAASLIHAAREAKFIWVLWETVLIGASDCDWIDGEPAWATSGGKVKP